MESEKTELDRRELIKMGAGAFGVAAGALMIGCGGSAGLSTTATTTGSTATTATTSTTATTGTTGGGGGTFADSDYLNFLLNLEYIKAQYYLIGTTGKGLEATLTGSGAGTVKGGAQVTFTTPVLNGLMVNLASDEVLHVTLLRSVNGSAAVSMPNIDFTDGFNAMAVAAGLGSTFNAFANEQNFLLGSFFFEDLAVTAQYGALALLTTAANVVTVAGMMGTDSYHAGAVRFEAFNYGATVLSGASQISALRGSLGGGDDSPPDQSISLPTVAPHDTNGLIYGRTTRLVENIAYLASAAASGGFFPNGFNGNIVSSLRRRR